MVHKEKDKKEERKLECGRKINEKEEEEEEEKEGGRVIRAVS